jgi:hypothetical protein
MVRANKAISLTFIFALLLAGCSKDPNALKQKYLKSGQDYFT